MKLLAIVHMYPPIHNAGGETTIHAAFRAMVNRGHEVKVLCRPHSEEIHFQPYEHEGVTVFRPPKRGDDDYVPGIHEQEWMRKYVKDYDPDLLLTHLDLTTMTMQLSLDTHKPLAHFFHNTFSIPVFHVSSNKCQLAIFNSNWIAEASKWEGPQIIIHPVVEPERYRCDTRTKITLVNPTPGKGADTFYNVSKLLPDYEFLTVKSVYGEQIAVPNISAHLHPNVETMEHTPDIREVFRKTKILLMPSEYESYGRVAIEAACSGIPTIAHPTPGLKEALGDAGIFVDRNDFQGYANAISRLMTDEVYYRKRSDLALELANSLEPESEFDRLEEALLITARDWTRAENDHREKLWTADRRIYKRADGSLTDDKYQAQSLYCAEGQSMSLAEAIEFGFASQPAVTVTPQLDTHDLVEDKMIAGPEENKVTAKGKKKVA